MNKVKTKKKAKDTLVMKLINPYSAGIDIADKVHVVAIPETLADTPQDRVKTFGTMTCDLEEIAEHLKRHSIETVAMESTGIYWKPLFNVLLQHGFDVLLVNAAHVKNVTGRKDDENDAMWIQKLHSCGLLSGSFLPEDEQDALRTLVRFRKMLVQESSRCVNRIQKSLELMNVKFHTVISDIVGKTGTAVLEAIINGERKAENFLPLISKRIKADHQTIVKSLQGNWRPEHLFTLKEYYSLYMTYRVKIATCDVEIEQTLQLYEAKCNEGVLEKATIDEEAGITKKRPSKPNSDKNCPRFEVRKYVERIYGIDIMAIYGIHNTSALEILSEIGSDLSKWKNEKHFVSWLNLCPNNKISGGKLISSRLLKRKPNPASLAFRYAANAVQKSEHWLGDYFRRKKSKGGNKYAIVATANKIATIFYKMVTEKQEFKPIDIGQYRERTTQIRIAYFEKRLSQLKACSEVVA